MSENLTRKNSLRRSIAAVIGAVSLACGSVAVPVVAPEFAQAARAADTDHSWDNVDAPEFYSEVFIATDVENPTDSFNYKLEFDVRAPRPAGKSLPGESNLRDLKVWLRLPDEKTELDRKPEPSDFRWASGQTKPIYSAEKIGKEWLVRFGEPRTNPDGTIYTEITDGDQLLGATLPAHVVDGSEGPFEAVGGAYGFILPATAWAEPYSDLIYVANDTGYQGERVQFHTTPDPCRAELWVVAELQGGGYGEKLVQFFMGTNDPDISLVPGEFSVKVTDPEGSDITTEVMQKAVVSDPEQTNPHKPFTGVPNPQWLQVWQWPFTFSSDVTESEVWLRSGTTIEVHQLVESESCYFDRQNDRALAHFVSLRPPIEAEAEAYLTFGNTASVGDRVWVDANRNGVQDEGEENLAGVNVTVTPPAGSEEEPRTATTDADGKWRVDGLTPGVEYTVSFELPEGYKATDALVGDDRGVDSNGLRSTVTLQSGEFNDTYDLGVFQQASVGDFVWEDTNGDGIQDEGEPAVPNTIVRVTGPNGETHTTATDKDGKWSVDGLTPGVEYTVEFTPPAGYQVTKPEQGEDRGKDSNPLSSTVSLKPGENNTSYDLGLVQSKPELASIGDRVWVDANRNGVQDEGEENLAGVNVTVTPPAGSEEEPRTATTDADGKWRVDGLTPGVEYTVSFELPEGYKATDALVGDDRGVDSNGLRSTVTLQSGEFNDTYDLGVFQQASVGDFVWEDTNGDGIQDEGEPAVPNTIVRVTGPNGETHTTATDKDGKWSVDGLTPGVEYTVEFTPPAGYQVTKPEQGEDRGKDSNPLSSTVSLKPGENNTTYDLGLVKPASIGDRVWVDENENGIQDENEKNGVPNARVTVTAPEGVDEQPRKTTTDDKGNWRIDGLTPGVEYTVTFELPEGVSATKSLVGDDRGVDSNELSTKITLESDQHDPTFDLGVVPASIGDRVWLDEGDEEKVGRADGIQDDDEGGIADVVVRVSRPGEEVRETKTGADGTWKIEGLTPGVDNYRVEFDAPSGYRISPTKAGDDAAVDSNGLSDKVAALKSGEFNDSYDLGLFPETETTTVPTPVTEEKPTEASPTPCDCSPTTVPTTVTSKVPVPTTTTQVMSTTKTQSVPTTLTTQVPVPTTLTTQVPVPTTTTQVVSTTKTQSVPTTLTTEVPVPTTVPTTTTQAVPTTVTKPVPTTVEKAVPTTVQTTTTAEAPKRGTIGDRVWEDTNGDGVEDPDEKTGVPNVPVVIVDKDGNEVTRTVTDENGNWKVDVEPGEYTVRYEAGDRTPSDPELVERTITIKPGEENFDVDLGILPSGSVGDRVWNDEDGDGEQGENEKGLENVVVLVSREGEPTRSAVTDANGDWKIEGLNPDVEYDIRFVKPEGWEVTGKVPGSDESGLVSKVTVKPNEYNDTYDLGLKKIDTCRDCEPVEPGTIGDRVWVDENGDGKEDPGEKTGVPGVTVIVKDPEGNEITRTVTDESGNWKVDVEPGDYVVEYVPGGETPSDPSQVERNVTVKPGEKRDDVDLGILPSGSVGDRVWNDEDGDGKQGENEKGLENVVVLVSREGEPTRSVVTDANGDWKIEGLTPDAEYEVRFVQPEGWEVTGKVPGSDESGLVSKVTVKPGEYNDTYDLGLKKIDPGCECEPVKPGTIGNRVWIDLNGNGKQDPNETEGVSDVTVIVRDADGNEVTRTVTDEDGNWKVNVEPGDYEIEYRPRDWKPTDPKRVTQKVTVEEGKEYLDLDLGVQKPKPGEPTPPTDEPAPDPEKGSSTETLDRCVANAVRSPLLYLVPVALLGAFGGEIARPYMGAINEQVNQINAQFQEAMRRNSPNWGQGGRGGRDNEQFAELRGQIDAANRRIAELGQDPNVQRFGTVAAGVIGLIAAGGVLYDWCSNEKGEAFTSIGGSSAKESGAEGRQSSSKDAA